MTRRCARRRGSPQRGRGDRGGGPVRAPPSGGRGALLLDGCCYLLVIALYALVAPGARVSLWAVLLGQAYVLARLWVKLLFCASEIAFFQRSLAHAGYTGTPPPEWPFPPAAEGIIRR